MSNPVVLIRCIYANTIEDKFFQRVEYAEGVEAEWTETRYYYSSINFKPASGYFPAIDRAWRWYQAYLDVWEDDISKYN